VDKHGVAERCGFTVWGDRWIPPDSLRKEAAALGTERALANLQALILEMVDVLSKFEFSREPCGRYVSRNGRERWSVACDEPCPLKLAQLRAALRHANQMYRYTFATQRDLAVDECISTDAERLGSSVPHQSHWVGTYAQLGVQPKFGLDLPTRHFPMDNGPYGTDPTVLPCVP
jgi:hypothetical protein